MKNKRLNNTLESTGIGLNSKLYEWYMGGFLANIYLQMLTIWVVKNKYSITSWWGIDRRCLLSLEEIGFKELLAIAALVAGNSHTFQFNKVTK